MDEPLESRVRHLEQRVRYLTATVVILALFLVGPWPAFMGVSIFVLSLPILAFTHRSLPRVARRLGRFWAWICQPMGI